MKLNILLTAVATTLSLSAAASTPQLTARNASHSITSMAKPALGQKAESPKLVVRCLGPVSSMQKVSDYTPAEKKIIRTEGFDSELFETGEIGNPDLYTNLKDPQTQSEHPAWYNLLPEAFNGEIWGGNNLYPAGGVACLFNKPKYEVYEANIVVPLVDASAEGYEGIVHLQLNARLEDNATPQTNLMFEAAETYDMAPSWKILGSGMADITNEWMKYDVAFYGGEKSVILNIYNAFGQSVYIDDLVVYQVGQPAMTPVALPATDYTGTSFTVNWEEAPGAESYLLDLYTIFKTYDEQGRVIDMRVEYLRQNFPVTGTSYQVTDATAGQKYNYTLRSVNGEFVSLPSNEIIINKLLPTTMHAVTDLSAATQTYNAEWDPIPGADVYNYWGRFERVADADGKFMITDENFKGVVDGDGYETGWTKEDPESATYPIFYYNDRLQQGWHGTWTAPYDNYICLDAWQYIYGNGDAGYISPEFDLSKDGGKVTLKVDLAANKYSDYDETGKLVEGYTRAAAVIFNWDEEAGDWRQDELFYAKDLSLDWKTKTFEFTSGSKRSLIGIYAVYAPENLYIDNVKLSQNYKAGESLIDPYLFERFYDNSMIEVQLPKHTHGSKLYHQVCGVRAEVDEESMMGGYKFLESPYTPLELVAGSDGGEWAGVASPKLSTATVQPIGDGEILIVNPDKKQVTITDLSGKVVYTAQGQERQTVKLPAGNYIVNAGHAVKVHI